MNWNNRITNYRNQLTSLKNQGWLTQADVNKYWNAQSDTGFQKGINLGNKRKEVYNAKIKHETGLQRTGGLMRPGGTISDEYYQRFLGISKQDLLSVPNFQSVVRETRGGTGGGDKGGWQPKPDRYKVSKPTIRDVEYVIRQNWESAYDPEYSRKQLKGNRKWELQSQYVDQYVRYVKGLKQQPSTGQTLAQKAAEITRRNKVLSSWSEKGMFPRELRGSPTRVRSGAYPGQKTKMGVTTSAEKVLARSRPAGIIASTQGQRLRVSSPNVTGTKVTALSGGVRTSTGVMAKSIKRKTSTKNGTRAKKVN